MMCRKSPFSKIWPLKGRRTRAKENETSEKEPDDEGKQDSVGPEIAEKKTDDENSVESKSSGESKRGQRRRREKRKEENPRKNTQKESKK